MKKYVLMFLMLWMCLESWSQSPQKFSYQAVIRNNNNQLVVNNAIGMQISILQGSITGTSIFVERHFPTTNANGLVSIEIGTGTIIKGNLNSIDWANGPYFIKTETDLNGGANYTISGTNQLLSVPYALHAKTAESATNADAFRTAIGAGTGNGTVTSISTGNGLTGGTITTTGTIGLTGQALALHSLNANGMIARTGTGTVVARSIAVSGSGINVSNGDGVGGNPTVSLNIGTGATQVAAGNHNHGNITSSGNIGTAAGRIVTTGTGGTLKAMAGTAAGQMLYWNGSAWVNVQPGSSGQVLTLVNGVPTWLATGAGANDVYNPTTGRIWMDRNLGASRAATSITDTQAYGDLYQWGRAADGHQKRNSATTSSLSSSDTPGHGNFILTPKDPYEWRSPQNANLWQGVNGKNNPCPGGYRLPTDAELNAERLSWSSNNAAGAFASPLKLPMAGYRSYGNGSLYSVGSFGYYWSSTVAGTYSRSLFFRSSDANMFSVYRASGLSVRCLKD